MTMPRFIAILSTAALLGSIMSSCPEAYAQTGDGGGAVHRLFPGRNDRPREDLRPVVDSLMQILDSLRAELDTRSLAEEVLAAAEEEMESDTLMTAIEPDPDQTDSLLTAWYHQKKNERFQEISDYNMDSVRFTTNVPDSVLIERLRRMNAYITLPFNETVKNYMILYSERNRSKMQQLLGLSTHYFPIFEEILDRYGMPLELKYMAVIESALNPVARSRAGARGMWQFMYQTARLYDLKITSFVDERLDVEKSADAAARYMQDAYNIFGDWSLAISSYNCGAGNVNKAIRRAGGKRDFWSIYPFLPRETRGYVPAFVGAMYAMTYYKEYGLVPEPVQLPAHTDTFEISRNLHFKQINELAGVPMEILRELNPQYTHDIVPGNEGTYILQLPYSYSNAFIAVSDSVFTYKADTLMSPSVMKSIEQGGDGASIRYKVRSGDNLSRIGARYHVSVAQLRKWNNLKSNNLRVGQMLTIYTNGYNPPAPKPAPTTASRDTQPKPDPAKAPGASAAEGTYVSYTVKSGDSLYSISQGYPGVSAQDIMHFNGITSRIKPGMVIKIPVKQ